MKNSNVGVRWFWLRLAVVVVGGGLGCERSSECDEPDVVCADELVIELGSLAGDIPFPKFTFSGAAKAIEDRAGFAKTYATTMHIESGEFDWLVSGKDIPSYGVSGGRWSAFAACDDCLAFPTRVTVTVTDKDSKRGRQQILAGCYDKEFKPMLCSQWSAVATTKVVEVSSAETASSAAKSVRCNGFSHSKPWPAKDVFESLTWGLSSSFSYKFSLEPALHVHRTSGFANFNKGPYAAKASAGAELKPKPENLLTITGSKAYALTIPFRLPFGELADAKDDQYVKAGWTFGGTTVGCKLKQSRFVEMLNKAPPEKDQILTVQFTQPPFPADLVGEHGWCYYISKVGETKVARPYRDMTAGAACELEK